MDKTTTLRVRTSTRDRVRTLGAARGQTSDGVVKEALELLEKETFWVAWQSAQDAATPAEHAEEQAEQEAWDRASAHDLQASERSARADR